jgi:polyhydroxyalkanoate synthase
MTEQVTSTNPMEKMFDVVNGSLAAFWHAQQAGVTAATRTFELMTNTYARLWGRPEREVVSADRRFEDDAWSENLAFDLMKRSYLIASQWMMDLVDGLEALDADVHHRAKFWSQQSVDALSPTNFPLTNPVVIQETMRTGGANLVRGMQNLLSDVQERRVSQVPEGSFEVGKDLAVTPGKVVHRNQLMELIQYSPTTEQVSNVPILVVPPWINKYYVMDMRPENSMFKYLVDSGFTLFAVSWKNADSSMRHLGWEDYMEQGPLEALRVIKSITRRRRVNLVGYCLGGLMVEFTLAYMASLGDKTANTATLFATHQDFTNAGDVSVFISEPEVKLLEWLMSASGGYLDGRNMAATFNMLRSNDLIWRYVINNYWLGKQPPALDLLYWNSDSTRVPEDVHSFLVRNFFLENKLIQPDALQVKGVGIDLGRITTPIYAVATRHDHIVPWKGAFKVRELVNGPVRFVLAGSGHIAGIINHPAQKKRYYWYCDERDTKTNPDAWFECANDNKRQGSWWVDWIPWLEKHSGKLIVPPPMGNDKYPPLLDAPGTYVLEK